MSISWISIPALVAVHLGFAGLLGAVYGTARRSHWQFTAYCALVFGGLLFLGANLALPLPMWASSLLWLASAAAFGLGSLAADTAAWRAEYGWYYAVAAMLLVLAWGLAQSWPSPAIALGLAAALAAALSWTRAGRQQLN